MKIMLPALRSMCITLATLGFGFCSYGQQDSSKPHPPGSSQGSIIRFGNVNANEVWRLKSDGTIENVRTHTFIDSSGNQARLYRLGNIEIKGDTIRLIKSMLQYIIDRK